MTAFLICFLVTPIFTYLAQKNFEGNDRRGTGLGIIFSIIAVLIPSIIAGVRDLTVGRDIGIYVTPVIESATSNSFSEYMASAQNEIGYSLLMYFITIFTDNVHFSLFVIQLITITFIYLFAYKKRDKLPMWMVMLIYLLTWYCISYTMMRQSIAVAIVIFSTVFFEKRNYIKTILLFLLAVSFHSTAILGVVVYLVIYIYSGKFSKRATRILTGVMLIGLVTTTLFYKELLYFFTNTINILPDKFYKYIIGYKTEESYTNYSELLYKMFWIFGTIFYMFKMRKKENNGMIILFLLLIDFSTFILSWKIVNMGRVGYYFFYLALLYLIPEIIQLYKGTKNKKLLVCITLIGAMFVFWYWKFPINSYCDTYPYTSSILPFLSN